MGLRLSDRRPWVAAAVLVVLAALLLLWRPVGPASAPPAPAPRPSTAPPLPENEEPAAPEEEPRATERVDGTVLSAFSGRPVAGARVHTESTGEATTTDEAGRFAIGLPLPDTIRVAADGFVGETRTVAEPGPLVVHLRPDRRLRVRVREEDGRPVTGATVTGWARLGAGMVYTRRAEAGRLFSAVTDGEGRAAVPWPLTAGHGPAFGFELEAAAPDGRWQFIAVEDLRDAPFEITLPAPTCRVVVRAGWDEPPPAGATLWIRWEPLRDGRAILLENRRLPDLRVAPLDAREVTLEVPPGVVGIQARFEEPEWSAPGFTEIVTPAKEAEYVVHPQPTHPLQEMAPVELEVVVRDKSDAPIADALVGLALGPRQEDFELWSFFSLRSDSQGRATLEQDVSELFPLYVLVRHPECDPAEVELGEVGPEGIHDRVEITMKRKLQPNAVLLRIEGADGSAVVAWYTNEERRFGDGCTLRPARDPRATHVLPLPPEGYLSGLRETGTTTVVFDAPGRRLRAVDLDAVLARAGNPEPLEVRLDPAIPVDVRVTHGGEPMAGARVLANCADSGGTGDPPSNVERVSDTDGRARLLIRSLPETEVFVIADHPECGAHAVRWDGAAASVTVDMSRPGTLAGQARYRGGEPAAGVPVSYQPQVLGRPLQDRFYGATTSADDGSFRLDGVIAGLPLRLSAVRSGSREEYRYAAKTVTAGETEITLTLEPLR